jgi:pimeloyl-ACP methyl ester carboxylesterase
MGGADVTSFSISVDEAELRDLHDRLARTRWPDAVKRSRWDHGVEPGFLRDLVDYWQTSFDWRRLERSLSALPQFKTEIDGIVVHFVHLRGGSPRPRPLLLTHGWPSSFLEYLKIIPLLVEAGFDLVIPSLPGHGFSNLPRGLALGVDRVAPIWAELMRRLGYERYAVHGGDWGADVSVQLGLWFPDRVAGVHLVSILNSFQPYLGPGSPLISAEERTFLDRQREWYDREGGYARIMATRPQTLAYGLNDSPAGLAAWIVEKFRAWSDCDGDLSTTFTRDELLANVSLYWFTQTANSAARLYFESARSPFHFGETQRVTVPVAVALFPEPAPAVPRSWAERCFSIVRWTDMPRGGHFPAIEEPELLARDIDTFFAGLV